MSQEKKILVTGASGCLGARLCRVFLEKGWTVAGQVRPSSDRSLLDGLGKLHIVEGDLREPSGFCAGLDAGWTVIHSAATLHVNWNQPKQCRLLFDVNVTGTQTLIDTIRARGVREFLYISSIAAMGDYSNECRDEHAECRPESPYGKSKLEGERLALAAHGVDFSVRVIRPGVIYGPGDRGTLLKLIRYIDRGIFRHIGDGENKKTLVAVENVAQAAYAVLDSPKAAGEVYLIVDREARTMREIAGTIAQTLGVRMNRLWIPRSLAWCMGAMGDAITACHGIPFPMTRQNVRNLTASATYSIDKLLRDTAYRQPVSFPEGIAEEIEWYRRERDVGRL